MQIQPCCVQQRSSC